jgi:NADP-dependent 3-hydroxy acid dehydrogenase YdfG
MPFSKMPIAWVTGASSGIGRATALALVAKGWRVAVSARRHDLLAELVAHNPQHMFAYPCDITQPNQVQGVVAQILTDLGRIDLALLNAGAYYPDQVRSLDIDHVKQQFDVNVFGTVNCVQAVMPHMLQRNAGHLALVGSVAGYNGLPKAFSYSATKAALINMAETLKVELNHTNIKVQIISPGFIETPATAQNSFKMPGLMKVEDAAEALIKGLASHSFEVLFPKGFTWVMRILNILPYPLYFAIMKRVADK